MIAFDLARAESVMQLIIDRDEAAALTFRDLLQEIATDDLLKTDQSRRHSRRGILRKPAVVFFTRKGNLEDGILAYEQVKPMAVIKKPDPWDENDMSEEAKDD